MALEGNAILKWSDSGDRHAFRVEVGCYLRCEAQVESERDTAVGANMARDGDQLRLNPGLL